MIPQFLGQYYDIIVLMVLNLVIKLLVPWSNQHVVLMDIQTTTTIVSPNLVSLISSYLYPFSLLSFLNVICVTDMRIYNMNAT